MAVQTWSFPDVEHPYGTMAFERYLYAGYKSMHNFDPSQLEPRLAPFYRNEVRVQLGGHPAFANEKKLNGYIGVTTGSQPCFMLMRRVRQTGSSDILLPRYFDEGLGVKATKPMYGAAKYIKFIESPRYLEIVAWYQLTLKIPRPIPTGEEHAIDLRNARLHQRD